MMRAPETKIVKVTSGHEKTRREVTQGNLNLNEALQGLDGNRVEVHRQAVTIVAMVNLKEDQNVDAITVREDVTVVGVATIRPSHTT